LKEINFYTPSLDQFRFSIEDRRLKAGSLYSYLQAGGDINVYNKLSNSFYNTRQSQQPIKVRKASLFNHSVKGFCSKNDQQEPKKETGFTAYLKKLIQIDKKKEDEEKSSSEKNLESILTKDPSEIKIGFHKIKSTITLDSIEGKPEQETKEQETQEEIEKKIKSKEDILIDLANKKYGIDFFKDFALSDEKMTQISLEEHIRDMPDKENIPLFVASLISNAYKLNSWIPN